MENNSMYETTNPESGVVDTPDEQDFSDFEKSLDATPETEQAEDEATDFDEGDTPETAPQAAEDDFDEVEYEGKAYKLPKELKGALLRQADYTRKTQEVAAMSKRLEPLVQIAEEASQVEQQASNEMTLAQARMHQLETTDWSEADQLTVMQAQIEYQGLQQRALQMQDAITQARHQRLSVAEQETAIRFEQGRKELAEKIPDFAAKAPKLAEHAIKQYGFTAEDLSSVEDPRFFIALNRLVDLEEQVAKQQAALKATKTVEVQPVQTLKGNSSRQGPRADTNDFRAFEKLADQKIRTRR